MRDCRYHRWFEPTWKNGPSGYREAPRPFVLRPLHHASVFPDGVAFQLTVFALSLSLTELTDALAVAVKHLAGSEQIVMRAPARVAMPLVSRHSDPADVSSLRICFDTPVELKQDGLVLARPDFSPLLGRLAERIWALGCFYHDWPANATLGPLLALSKQVKLIAFEWHRSEVIRRSSRSNSFHSIGGFTGYADYRGPLGAFLPVLTLGEWTGVGRHTVWGKGAFHLENIATPPTRQNA